jgi:hypothetical protein
VQRRVRKKKKRAAEEGFEVALTAGEMSAICVPAVVARAPSSTESSEGSGDSEGGGGRGWGGVDELY